jgi:acylphosphatase
VSGRVQGVGYRAATCARARSLGLAGWVRNRPDGRVEIEAEGEPRQLQALRRWCEQGPELALVDAVAVEPTACTGEAGFALRR